jgi:glycosyltransferase involved in cell wall biosynthesis
MKLMNSSNPKVSVIIPTFNSERTLAICLQSIKDQTYLNTEVIVVDGYSRDNTLRIAEEFNAKVLLSRSERCAARNFGSKEAKGVFVFFIDSDMELAPNVVEECVELVLQRNIGAVIIPEESVAKGFLSQCKRIEKEMRVDGEFSEASRFFKKEVFDSVGGFDENLVIGEDFDLNNRINTAGYRTARCKARIRHHEEEISITKLILKIYYYGKTLPSYMQKDPALAAKTSCPIHIAKNLKLISKYPMPFAGLLVLKLVEYITYTAGLVSSLLSVRFLK